MRTRYLIAYNGTGSGLGNRVRVLLGAKSLARYEDRRFLYVWPRGSRFQPRISDLWDFAAGDQISRIVSRSLSAVFPYEERDARSSPGPDSGPRIRQIRTGGELLLPVEADCWRDEFRSMRPTRIIAQRVTDFYQSHLAGQPYVGVQIRAHRVSHQVTRSNSPVEWYLARMREIAYDNPDVRFFVSSDVSEIFDEVTRKFANAVGLRDKGPYNSTAGVQDAVVDLYLLGSSSYLIGPYGSSFVHLAEHLSGDQLKLETAKDGLHGPIEMNRLGLVEDPLAPAFRLQQ